jgi:hypothetical protein
MTWTDGLNTWAGSPFCNQVIDPNAISTCSGKQGISALLCPDSPAIDAADKNCTRIDTFTLRCNTGPDDTPPNSVITVSTVHCPAAGSALNQPRLPDTWASYCQEWYGAAPDIGACEYVPASTTKTPNAPIQTNVQ